MLGAHTGEEVWKDIPSLPGVMASSWGRIMVRPYEASMPHGGKRTYGGHAWYGCEAPDEGRIILRLRGKTHKVHFLVCEAHIGPRPFPKAVVMHLDEDWRHNWASNLEWGTQKQNMNFP